MRRLALLALLLATPATAQVKPVDAAVQARAMGPGVNAISFDPIWDGLEKRRFQPRHFAAIRAAGFRSIRVGLFAFRHMDGQNRLSPSFVESLDWVIGQALAHDLVIVIENHDMATCGTDAAACKPKLMAFWEQVAARYKDKPAALVFEPINEPNGGMDAVWNAWVPDLLAVIRRTNPTRNVVIDAAGWAYFAQVPKLALPKGDRHLIATFHYYDPRPFTHQGAKWAEAAVRDVHDLPWGSAADRAQLNRDFDGVAAWAKANDRPVLLGEFGAYDAAPTASRTAYFDAVARAAEARGWPWMYWQFDHDFIVYDMDRDQWVTPVLRALIPNSPSAR